MLDGQSISSAMREELSYDKMGNIQTLKRDGGTTTSYHYMGNRLTSLSGGLTGSYSYDANGNALTDRTGFTYTYNHLNQPSTISKTGVSISYSYDALGNKRKSVGAIGSGITQDYINGIEYTNGILDRIATAEGYITFSGSTPVYQYYLRDHLGNVRTVFSASGGTATVIQQQDYYPFGLRKALAGSGMNAYLYNGKELQGELGQYDYGARFYDPVIGRWNVVDPLASSYYSYSPYSYAANNPIKFIDVDGRDIIIFYTVQNSQGKWREQSFRFTGTNASTAPDNHFVKNFIRAYEYNVGNKGGSNMLEAATNSDIEIELRLNKIDYHSRGRVYWDPFTAHDYGDFTLSPATVLEHEMAHAVSFSKDASSHRDRQDINDPQYGNAEERRVITGPEKETATKNNEMKPGQVRQSHAAGKGVKVNDPTSVKEARPFPWSMFDDRFPIFMPNTISNK